MHKDSEVGRCRCVAELPQEERDLPAVVGRVIEEVLNEVCESIVHTSDVQQGTQLIIRELGQKRSALALKRQPRLTETAHIRESRWRRILQWRSVKPPLQPALLAPHDVDQRSPE